ncbi:MULTISPECIES: phospholipase A [unclassified Polaromonas]|jgi:phospholipase A1|uniref:phospholipase A n=1 Tax=unclassified Polaromonas TaxID=2638319 RepID=UPI000BCF0242|nr:MULTISPECIES: phospholipase A [unclassified Polaromonas]OYY34348.1 MAG: phospholipase [Polaromonas sp. 35-63-35]OYZ17848.1 MAG: phospholipase [Polaromonas sp. 16-63-31]OYZ77246.1 MAG: phospholipase [Polaromonas sp. 24-63-21]OZA48178.1 MAG: phospholipase [Polaromonas sp. 17-63-33]OZA86704.1 MAG: phospholipase [Polaromonas sp. 39-63-25]
MVVIITPERRRLAAPWLYAALLVAGAAQAQTGSTGPTVQERNNRQGWQACHAMSGDAAAQLACFKNWAVSQLPADTPPPSLTTAPANADTGQKSAEVLLLPAMNTEAPDGKKIGCRNTKYSELSRFWELQRGSDCDTFGLRGYRPISVMWSGSNSINNQPSSEAPGYSASTPSNYRRNETRLQLSVRTKLAKGMLASGGDDESGIDSLWFGYTQQSYWQLFNSAASRPFRTTDHEPELVYIYPHQIDLAGGWKYRLSGLGLNHQSNGQGLPQSRSWNRVYLMGAAEKELGGDSRLDLQARVWQRVRERSGQDENPGISDYIGRAELAGHWQINRTHTLGLTLRHSLKSEARGSARLEWMKASTSIADSAALRYHVQLFSGYGDSLVDYNRRRTVLSVGLSLVDW